MKKPTLVCLALFIFSVGLGAADLASDFASPPLAWKSRPLWFWNARPTQEAISKIMERGLDRGYAGFGILPCEQTALPFMSKEYLEAYRHAIETAARLGQKMCLYDEYWFPSGSAGGLLRQRYPEALSKRLDHVETDITGPASVQLEIPAGDLMAAVAINNVTWKRLDLIATVKNHHLIWQAPAGSWSVMAFVCVPDGSKDLVDYLDPAAVSKFVAITYQGYFNAFGKYFGNTIDRAFYDEPTMHWTGNGRAWTPAFNRKFEAVYHRNPATLYPALWREIGPETAAARNQLFGFRARLFAEGFVKTISDWCASKGIELTGHQDQEEIPNPVCLSGDLIKCFEHQQIPGVDEIVSYNRGAPMFKIASSAAVNYGRHRVMSETFGAMNNMPVPVLYKEAMDQYAKGINWLVPHAVWSDPAHIIFPPELSGSTEPYAAALPRFNEYVGRCQRLLQSGQPVVDLTVLYPINDLQAATYFDGPLNAYNGVILPPWTDYQAIGERLSRELRLDFTYLHPETLNAKCQVQSNRLHLAAPAIPQDYRVIVLPGSQVISADNLAKIKAFYDHGGQVIATTCLPAQSAEPGRDNEVRKLVRHIFGIDSQETGRALRYPLVRASSVSTQFNTPETPGKAVDGNLDTLWSPGAPGEQWLEVDFGQNRLIQQIALSENQTNIASHRAEYWSGLTWKICGKGERIGARKVYTFSPVAASKARVVATPVPGKLPRIAEFAVYDSTGKNLAQLPKLSIDNNLIHDHTNSAGGCAWFIEQPSAEALASVLVKALPVSDVAWSSSPVLTGGNLTYLHQEIDGRQNYFFANSSDHAVSLEVTLRGEMALERWDPHTGTISPQSATKSGGVTRVPLQLAPVSSVFFMSVK